MSLVINVANSATKSLAGPTPRVYEMIHF